jgi:hypothetical protein
MAIIVRGKSRCAICGERLEDADEIRGFPPFIVNELDPLHLFTDAGVHEICLERHPRRNELFERLDQYHAWIERRQVCSICGGLISDPDEWFGFFRVTLQREGPCAPFEEKHYHYACLRGWNETGQLVQALREHEASSKWKGAYIGYLFRMLARHGCGS